MANIIKDWLYILKIRWILRNKTQEEKVKIITRAVIEMEILNSMKDALE